MSCPDFSRARRTAPPALALVACLALAAHASAAVRILSTDAESKPADPDVVHVLTPFDCTGRDTLDLAPGMVDTLRADTSDGVNTLGSYPCAPWNEQGPEHIYRLEVQQTLELWAGLRDLGAVDLDLFLLDGCDSDACLVGVNVEFTAILDPGTYYLVVDGYGTSGAAAGPYALAYETREPGVPLSVCEPGGAEVVECAGAQIVLDGDLAGRPDLVRSFACNPSPLRGGEAWYAVTLPGVHEVTVQVLPTVSTLDPAIWVFDGCGADAVCLQFADDKLAGQTETLIIDNQDETPLTVYVAVDSPRTVGEGEGTFQATFKCQSNVADEKTSLGSVRAMFR